MIYHVPVFSLNVYVLRWTRITWRQNCSYYCHLLYW